MDEKPIRGGGVGGGRGGGSSKRRCRYGAECRSRNCKFVHPPPTICTTTGDNNTTNNNDVNKKSNSKMPQEKNNCANPKRDRSKIQCRYGMECRNTKCPFFHHPAAAAVPVVPSPTCVRVPPPISNGSVPTTTTTKSPPKSSTIRRNGHNPSSTDTVEQQSSHPSAHSNGKSNTATTTTTTTTTPSRKATTKKKCRWGAGCRNKKCTFLHPGQVFDKDAVVQSPRQQKATGLNKPKCSTVTPHKAMPSDHRTKVAKVSTTTRPLLFAYHPILPPSPAATTQEHPPNKRATPNNASYPTPALLFPPPSSSDPTVSRSPFQTTTTNMPIIDNTAQTSEVISRILFSPNVSIDDPISGFLGEDDESRERTPLYSKTSAFRSPLNSREDGESRERTPLYSKTSAFRSPLNSMGDDTNGGKLESHAQFSQPARKASVEENYTAIQSPNIDGGLESHALFFQPARETSVEGNCTAIHLQDQPPDADWLFEVLGLNDLDVNDTAASPMIPVIKDVFKEPFNVTASSVNASFICTPPAEQIRSTPKSELLPAGADNIVPKGNKKSSKKLIPDDEIVQSRSAALELRLESKQYANHGPELFFTLLQKCRSKQEMIKTALEQFMDSSGEAEIGGEEIDETNIVALLELNEQLVGAIDVAESSSHSTKRGGEEMEGGGVEKVVTANSCPNENVEGSKREIDASWKPMDKKRNITKLVMKKTKPTENAGKQKKPAKKSSQPSKSVKMASVNNQKQDTKPAIVLPESESPIDKPVPSPTQDSAVSLQQEKEKMARMLEEARKQAAAARERKKSKKNKKFDRWLKQNEDERERRAKTWAERIAKENDYIDLIGKLMVAEFLRQSMNKAMGLTAERVLTDTHASEVIAKECREAYGIIFGGLKCRVVVAGSENKDMNGRHGTIRFWDREKDKFCVGLDTKKSPDSDVQFLIPETLDVLASSRPPKTDKKSTATSCDIHAPDLLSYGGVSLGFSFTLQKSHVVGLGSAESTRIGLRLFCKSRDQEERMQKIEEEAEKKREEEDRKRRAARRAKENAAWEKRKERMRKDKEDYERMKQEWAKDRREYGGSMFDYDDVNEEECQCPRCRFGDRFSSSGGSFFFNIGGIPFRVRFDNYDSDEGSFFDEFDERWEEQLAEEKEEENRKQANVLGVEPEDDSRTIKLAYRKMALKFHPDKWKRDSQHGMSRKAAEDRFKVVQAAYDHMMSNFDD